MAACRHGDKQDSDWTMPLLVRQAKGLPVERLPVWLMRQAGRYLPEYHERRKRADGTTVDFFDAIRDAEMAADLTLQVAPPAPAHRPRSTRRRPARRSDPCSAGPRSQCTASAWTRPSCTATY